MTAMTVDIPGPVFTVVLYTTVGIATLCPIEYREVAGVM